MVHIRPAAVFGCILAAVGALAAQSGVAEIYKWVDEHGVVNYSSDPPPHATALTKLTPVPERLSVYPHVAALTRAGTEREDILRERIALLEREIAFERRQREVAAQAELDRRQRAYEDCVRSRRVDCEQEGALQPLVLPSVVVVRAPRRPNIVPTLPVAVRKPPATKPAPLVVNHPWFKRSNPNQGWQRL